MIKKYRVLFTVILAGFFFSAFFNFNIPDQGKSKVPNLDNIKVVSRSTYLIQHEYYDAARVDPVKMLKEGFYELAKEVPEVLPKFTDKQLTLSLGSDKIDITLPEIKKLYDILPVVSQAFDYLKTNYKGETKFDDMEYAFVGGMLAILDPHSNIMPPKVYEEFKTQTQGEYGGLGIVIGIKESELTVIAPIEDTPAYRAGIQADDKIVQIDDQNTTNMMLSDAVDLMRGPKGTKVVLKIKNKNTGIKDFVLTREMIIIKSIDSKLLSYNNQNYGVIRIKGFQEDTYDDMVTALGKLKLDSKNNLSGLILDFRNNPGGLLDQAILIADHFLKSGDIVFTVGPGNQIEESAVARPQDDDVALSVAVLINEGSASASEIVAGAFKNNDRAIVIGQKSFGKGSVQSLFNLRDGSSLKLTVAQYLTPGRESIQAVGISPDIHLYPSIIGKDYFDIIEDTSFGEEKLDAHLDNSSLIKKSKSTYTISFVKNTETEAKKKDDEGESSYVSKIDENDYPIQLAMKVLEKAENKPKKQVMPLLKTLINDEAKTQDAQLADALKAKKLDWSMGQKSLNPALTVRCEFLNEAGSGTTELTAGKTVIMRTFVKNADVNPVYRVQATIDAFNPLLNHKEFIFGKLEPNEEKSRDIKIEIPADIVSFTESVKLLVYTEKSAETPLTKYIATSFIDLPQPQLAYSYKIQDDNSDTTKGNGNGIPEAGESIKMSVSVKNMGTVDSQKTSINLKNNEGKFVFLTKARDTIGLIKAGLTVTKDLTFDVKPDFAKDELKIDFFALDGETKASISDKLVFKTKPTPLAEPKSDQLQTAPQVDILSSTFSNSTLSLKAIAKDTANLKDITVFAKGRKVFYVNLEKSKGATEQAIDQEIPLEEGINSIVIQARGQRDILGQKSMSVVFSKESLVAVTR